MTLTLAGAEETAADAGLALVYLIVTLLLSKLFVSSRVLDGPWVRASSVLLLYALQLALVVPRTQWAGLLQGALQGLIMSLIAWALCVGPRGATLAWLILAGAVAGWVLGLAREYRDATEVA
jgi:hypothetical protein